MQKGRSDIKLDHRELSSCSDSHQCANRIDICNRSKAFHVIDPSSLLETPRNQATFVAFNSPVDVSFDIEHPPRGKCCAQAQHFGLSTTDHVSLSLCAATSSWIAANHSARLGHVIAPHWSRVQQGPLVMVSERELILGGGGVTSPQPSSGFEAVSMVTVWALLFGVNATPLVVSQSVSSLMVCGSLNSSW